MPAPSVLWKGASSYSLSAGAPNTVSQAILTIPPTTPTSPLASLWIALLSGKSGGAPDAFGGAQHHRCDLNGTLLTGLGALGLGVTSYGGFIFTLDSAAVASGGTVTLAIDLGTGGVPLADAGVIVAIVYDPNTSSGFVPRNDNISDIRGGSSLTTLDTSLTTKAVAPYVGLVSLGLIGSLSAGTFSTTDGNVTVLDQIGSIANNAAISVAAFTSTVTDTNTWPAFPPLVTFDQHWTWSGATSIWEEDTWYEGPKPLPAAARRRTQSYAQVIGD